MADKVVGDTLYVEMYRYPLEESHRKCAVIHGVTKDEYVHEGLHETVLKITPQSDFVVVYCDTIKKLREDGKYVGTRYIGELYIYEKGIGWKHTKLIEDILV